MPADRDDLVFVRHILEAISKIQRYTEGMSWEEFLIDEKTQDAVVRQFEVVGEAAKKVSEAFRNQHPNVPWSQMARMRDVLIHHYFFGVDLSIVCETDQRDLPVLLSIFRVLVEGSKATRGCDTQSCSDHGGSRAPSDFFSSWWYLRRRSVGGRRWECICCKVLLAKPAGRISHFEVLKWSARSESELAEDGLMT